MEAKDFFSFRTASKLDRESSEVQVNSLLYPKGRDAEPIFNSFAFSSARRVTPILSLNLML